MSAEKVKASVLKHVDAPGLMADMLDEVLEPTLQKLVADSSNALDDVLMAALYPVLEKELKEKSAEYWQKLLAPSAEEVVKPMVEDPGSSPA